MRKLHSALTALVTAALITAQPAAAAATPHRVGAVTWHAGKYVSQALVITGYVLEQGPGYVLLSDEPTGAISAHDLPVIGTGVDQMQLRKKYVVHGKFISGGFKAANGNPYHFELSAPPVAAKP